MSAFATEKRAPGICDRCGEQWPLKKLRSEYVRGMKQSSRVCPSCWDYDNPQNWEGSIRHIEREGLRNPRPDSEELRQVRSRPGWAPVGNEAVRMQARVGKAHAGGG